MAEDKPHSPHDALVRAIFGTPAHMAEELRAALPPEVAALLDLASLQPLPAHFADGRLEGAESDLLFSVRVGARSSAGEQNKAGRRALIYVLVEHQSAPDRFMPLRLLRYVGRILDDYRQRHPRARRLPAVIPIVLCHDRRPWPHPLDFDALYDLPREGKSLLAPYLPNFRFLLDDLGAIDVAQLTARASSPLVAVTLFILQRARHTTDLLSELLLIAPQFAALERTPVPREQIAAALWYIWHVGHVAPGDLLGFTRAHAGSKLETIMKTAAEQMRDQGRAEGRAELLLKLVQLKFGVVPSNVGAAVRSATIEQLDRWAERVLSAERAEDIVRE